MMRLQLFLIIAVTMAAVAAASGDTATFGPAQGAEGVAGLFRSAEEGKNGKFTIAFGEGEHEEISAGNIARVAQSEGVSLAQPVWLILPGESWSLTNKNPSPEASPTETAEGAKTPFSIRTGGNLNPANAERKISIPFSKTDWEKIKPVLVKAGAQSPTIDMKGSKNGVGVILTASYAEWVKISALLELAVKENADLRREVSRLLEIVEGGLQEGFQSILKKQEEILEQLEELRKADPSDRWVQSQAELFQRLRNANPMVSVGNTNTAIAVNSSISTNGNGNISVIDKSRRYDLRGSVNPLVIDGGEFGEGGGEYFIKQSTLSVGSLGLNRFSIASGQTVGGRRQK